MHLGDAAGFVRWIGSSFKGVKRLIGRSHIDMIVPYFRIMIRWLTIALSFLAMVGSEARSQRVKPDPYPTRGIYLGVGLGQDMGGLGVRLSYLPTKYASCFIGGGWAVVDAAWNAGIELRAPVSDRTTAFVVGMHGYNGIVAIQNNRDRNRIYYGPTIGVGIAVRDHLTRNHWRFSINLPIRPNDFYEYINALQLQGVVFNPMLPFTLGVAYHMNLSAAPKAKAQP